MEVRGFFCCGSFSFVFSTKLKGIERQSNFSTLKNMEAQVLEKMIGSEFPRAHGFRFHALLNFVGCIRWDVGLEDVDVGLAGASCSWPFDGPKGLFAYVLVIVVVAMWLGFVMFWLLASWHNLSKDLFFVLNSIT